MNVAPLRVRRRVVVTALTAFLVTGCSSEPSTSEQFQANRIAAFEEVYALADQAARDGTLGDRENRLAWMEEAAIQTGTLPGENPPLRDPEMLPERRFWNADGTLKPLEEMTEEERRAFISWVQSPQVADAIDGPRIRGLMSRARLGF